MSYPYCLEDLSSYTDVPVRTIRNWITRGVVPYASGTKADGKYRYGPEHLKAIRDMLDFKDQQMTIAEYVERKRWEAGELDDDD